MLSTLRNESADLKGFIKKAKDETNDHKDEL
jgi:hypothetical protein